MKLLFIILVGFSIQANTEIYKCIVDGEIIFSQQKCADEAELIEIKTHLSTEDNYSSNMEAIQSSLAYHRKMAEQDSELGKTRRRFQSNIDALTRRINRINRDIRWYFSGGANIAESNIIGGLKAERGSLVAQRYQLISDQETTIRELKQQHQKQN